jgi:RecB family endonuclease NucS
LCRDEQKSALVVVELKRGLPSDRVVGQTARYIGWVRANLAKPAESVEGIIIAHESDDRLRYAASAIPGLSLLTYEITFGLRNVPPVEPELSDADQKA